MASVKRIGFLWGEEKITLVDYKKNAPFQVYSAALGSRTNIASPFSSSLTEDVQITAVLQKMLQDNKITGRSFYVTLPMKEIILRSFIIPFVKQDDIQSAIKFEAKKYLPIDIQDLSFVFYATPFTENQVKRLQIIFFAVRKELLSRYEHIFNQVNAVASYCEPCVVSLAKVLLFKKEIGPQDNVAFLVLDKTLGRICFIDQGIPQFIREFFISSQTSPEESHESPENLNFRIVNEVANSFDFYIRQFNTDRITQMLVSTEEFGQDLFSALETELKIKIRKASPIATAETLKQSSEMDTVYALGACIDPPLASLSEINFLGDKSSKSRFKINAVEFLKSYKEIIFLLFMCAAFLAGMNIFFKVQLKMSQAKYDQLSSKEGTYLSAPVENIQSDLKDMTDKLAAYKNIRVKSDAVLILLRISSHIPQGTKLKLLSIDYNPDVANDSSSHVSIELRGNVVGSDPDGQIAVINQIYADLKQDKELARFVQSVNLVSLNHNEDNTDFIIHCS